MKRAVILVIDSMGIGAMSDAPEYGDLLECNTLANVAKFNKGLKVPTLELMGLGNIQKIEGVSTVEKPLASFGKMAETSKGKDTTTGHWEMAGLILEEPFKTYPEGFPKEIMQEFVEKTGCKGFLANYPASGTEIISKLGDEHVKTGFPIIYTSADSVFQIACHVDVIPLETQYRWCEIARQILNGKYNVSRVIARPFEGLGGSYKRVSKDRRDYSVPPTSPTILNKVLDNDGITIGIGKIEDIFVKSGISHAVHTGSNLEGIKLTLKALSKELDLREICIDESQRGKFIDKELIFTNLVDTDMLFGHRNDPVGYGKAIEEIDLYMGDILRQIGKDDLLIVTADHGCDPTTPGTDHTREYVPVLVYNPNMPSKNLGVSETFADVAYTVSKWLSVPYEGPGESLLTWDV